jgi:hypothetical protein
MNEDRDTKAQQMRSLIPVGHRGVELRSLDDFYRFSQYVIAAGMVPHGIQNEAGVLVAIQRGAEVGLLPMQSLQSIYIVNGMPQLFGDAPLALIEGSGLLEEFEEHPEGTFPQDDYQWVCTVKRKGRPTKRVERFSIAQAKRARLWDKKTKNGEPTPWVLYPERMLMWRARGYALRGEFADVLKGISIRELMDDEDYATLRARPAVGNVVEPNFDPSPPVPQPEVKPPPVVSAFEEPPKRGRGRPPKSVELPKGSLFGELTGKPEPEPEPHKAPDALKTISDRLKAGNFSEEDFLVLLSFAGLLPQVDTEDIKLGHFVLANVPEAALKGALEDWQNVEMALGQKVWEKHAK